MDEKRIQFLIMRYIKNNLTVDTSVKVDSVDYSNGCHYVSVSIQLKLDGEVISNTEDTATFYIPE